MQLRGVRVYGTSELAYKLDDDGLLHLWPDASQAPSEAKSALTAGLPWSLRTVFVVGTDDEIGSGE